MQKFKIMNHDKETLEAAEVHLAKNWINDPNNHPLVNKALRNACRAHFLAGVAYAREKQGEEIAKLKAKLERTRERLLRVKLGVNALIASQDKKGLGIIGQSLIGPDVIQILDELLGEK